MSLTNDFVNTIELKILKGEWKRGQKIPTLRELSQEMGISRSVVNAGIVELISRGYLKAIPRQRTIVNDWKIQGTLAVLDGIMKHNIWDEEALGSFFKARFLIECECAYLAAKNRSKEDLDNLRDIIFRETRESGDNIDSIVSNDTAFHHSIAVASKNIVYPLILKSFEKSAYVLLREFYSNNNVYSFIVVKHREAYQAIETQNADLARNIMAKILEHGEKIIIKK